MSTDATSILIIRPSALGDVCRSVPLAVSLRAAYPASHIAWVVQEGFEDAVRHHPAVDEVIPFPRRRWKSWWRPSVIASVHGWLAKLRGRFAIAVDAQGLGRSGLIAWGTRARRRIGFRDAREFGWLGLTERHQVDRPHTVDRMLGLLQASGIPPIPDMRLHQPPAAAAWWAAARAKHGVGDRYAVFAPTSRWVTKDWPAERWRELAPAVLERGLDSILFIGTAGEAAQVRAAMPHVASDRLVDLSGKTDVGQGMAVIAGSSLVVANDSAPLHIAVGFERRIIALFGPTDPAAVGPYRRESSVVRSPSAERFRGSYRDRSLGDRLMRDIAVADVLEALDAGRAEPPRAAFGHGAGDAR